GSVARSRRRPEGSWARQELAFQLAEESDLEWLPQELVLYADGLYEQTTRVELEEGASLLAAEVVRLGRTAAGEQLGAGRWRSALEIRRQGLMVRAGSWWTGSNSGAMPWRRPMASAEHRCSAPWCGWRRSH
ncbi:MAG: urease accessory protein UreD, partial [Cyanobium sp.]